MKFGTEFWAAIAGAIVAGIIALAIQLIALRAIKKEHIAERRRIRTTLGHSILFKTMRIQSNFINLHLHIESSMLNIDADEFDQPWTVVMAHATTPDDIHFSPEEMSLVLSLGDTKLTDLLMSLDAVHNNLIGMFDIYGTKRNDLHSEMPAVMDGNVGKSKFNEDQWKIIHPKMVVLNHLIIGIRERAETDYENACVAVEQLRQTLNRELDLELKIEFKDEILSELRSVKSQLKAR